MSTTKPTTALKVLDLFCGCGGLSLGLEWAKGPKGEHFQVAAAVDNWAIACKTYEKNHGIEPYNQGVTSELIKEIIGKTGKIDIVVGGPPCQGFSTSGKRSLTDPRNKLVLAFLEAVSIAKPKAFIMENVVGFTTFQDGQLLSEVKQMAREMGYKVRAGVVQASIVGVPQRRRRFVLVGVKSGQFTFPGELDPDFSVENSGLDVDLTFRDGDERWSFNDATSDLPSLQAGQTVEEYATPAQNELQAFLRKGAKSPSDHTAVGHRPKFIEMMSYIPEGKSALDPEIAKTIPEEIRPKSGYPNSYARIKGSKPSPTITRNFTTPSSANCIHPAQDRAMSIREGARCQSFPDRFVFLGNIEEKRLQIGNAVPPLLGKAIGENLLRALFPNS
jgi:DNA (cytosine-5)-methyltransferase 1